MERFRVCSILIVLSLVFSSPAFGLNTPPRLGGDDSEQLDYFPRVMRIGLAPSYLDLPPGSDSAAFEDCEFDEAVGEFLSRYGPRIVKRSFPGFDPHNYSEYDHIPPLDRFFAVHFEGDIDVPEVAERLSAIRGVLFAEPSYFLRRAESDESSEFVSNCSGVGPANKSTRFLPDDPVFHGASGLHQWNLHDDGAGIGCQTAWDYAKGDPEVRIGNMDFGIWAHIDLDVTGGLFVDYDEDDGWFVTDRRILDQLKTEHGTKSAGILAAQTNNGIAIAGIAGGEDGVGGCSLYDLQLSAVDLSKERLDAWALALFAAVDPVGDYKCNVVSISLQASPSNYSEKFRAVSRFANAVGANIVTGNGRATGPGYPALFDKHWITVTGAHDSTGAVVTDSGRGHGIDLVAPGGAWSTTHPISAEPPFETENLGWYVLSSCAIPHVAGSIALLRSFLGNGLAPEDYENILKHSTNDELVDDNPQTWNEDYGYGKVRIDSALTKAATFSILEFQTTNTTQSDQELVEIEFFSGPYAGSLHSAYRYRVSGYISFGGAFSRTPVVWGRCEPAYAYGSHGLSDYSPNYGEPFHDVEETTVDEFGCMAFTYVYCLQDEDGKYSVWYPAHYSQIPVAVKAMGPIGGGQKSEEHGERRKTNITPNPFNARVSLSHRIEDANHVVVDVVDVRGRIVCRLLDEHCQPGQIDLVWRGLDDSGCVVGSGTYFLRISDGEMVSVDKISLIK